MSSDFQDVFEKFSLPVNIFNIYEWLGEFILYMEFGL
jgi:hypothetical protein